MTTAEAGRKQVKFEFKGNPGSQVFVGGTFNGWKPKKAKLWDRKGDGVYTTRLLLALGKHEYKFIVDGTWSIDPTCSESNPDGHGGINSVVTVG